MLWVDPTASINSHLEVNKTMKHTNNYQVDHVSRN